ncbi:MAG: imidazole glycerol phosphate synthase subunit HisH [Oscillospiraceae bacterium]|nr:imidazole glycerol phosphate synthase subunit HisH [Oscillospiraceae bacterium]
MIGIIDYGVGNLFSLSRSLQYLGLDSVVTSDKQTLYNADRIILPGVGAFEDAAKKLRDTGLFAVVQDLAQSGRPLLGICLGMQLLFDRSFEFGEHEGLSLVPGDVCPLRGDIPDDLKVPHIGWNSLHFTKPSPLFKYSKEGDYVYYVHSFYAKNCSESTVAVSEYGTTVTGAVQRGNVFGTQFHPEKSGEAGLRMLRSFAEL